MSPHVVDRLSAYRDGELPAPERTAVEGHLRECLPCARHLEELAAVDQAARALHFEAPQGYFESLPAHVLGHLRPPVRRGLHPAWALGAAAVLAVAILTPRLVRLGAVEPAPAAPAVSPRPEPQADLSAPAGETRAPAPPASALPAKGPPPVPRVFQKRREEPFAADAPPPNQPYAAGAPAAPAPQVLGDDVTVRSSEKPVVAGASAPTAQSKVETQAAGALKRARPPEEDAVELQAAPARVPGGRAGRAEAKDFTVGGARLSALMSRTPTNAREARELRESFRALVPDLAEGARDQARVQQILMGAAAYHFSQDPADLAVLREDAAAYLKQPGAPQVERVHRVLESLPQ